MSILGYGAMRLPTTKPGDPENTSVNEKEAIRLIRMGIDGGITHVDTAYNYHKNESEIVVGKALKNGYREKVTLSTKAPIWKDTYNKKEHFRAILNEQLKKLAVDYIDVYYLHALNVERWKKVQDLEILEEAEKAKKEGKIRYLGFSFHDKPDVIKDIVASDAFDAMLIQYNILDTQYKEMIDYVAKKGLGVAVMGPVGGGRLAGQPNEQLQPYLTPGKKNFVDLALKFVWANPNICIAYSGMGSEEMVVDNLTLANAKDIKLIKKQEEATMHLAKKIKELSDIICTNCKYCMPCKQNVNIPHIFGCLIAYEIYGHVEEAIRDYTLIGKVQWIPGVNAKGCIQCGECMEKCPQHIEIIDQLKKAHEILTK